MEQRNNTGPGKPHFTQCSNALTEDCIGVLAYTVNIYLYTLIEALFIKEIDPDKNNKDEYRQTTLLCIFTDINFDTLSFIFITLVLTMAYAIFLFYSLQPN